MINDGEYHIVGLVGFSGKADLTNTRVKPYTWGFDYGADYLGRLDHNSRLIFLAFPSWDHAFAAIEALDGTKIPNPANRAETVEIRALYGFMSSFFFKDPHVESVYRTSNLANRVLLPRNSAYSPPPAPATIAINPAGQAPQIPQVDPSTLVAVRRHSTGSPDLSHGMGELLESDSDDDGPPAGTHEGEPEFVEVKPEDDSGFLEDGSDSQDGAGPDGGEGSRLLDNGDLAPQPTLPAACSAPPAKKSRHMSPQLGSGGCTAAISLIVDIPLSSLLLRLGQATPSHSVLLQVSTELIHFMPTANLVGILGVPAASLHYSVEGNQESNQAFVRRIASLCGVALTAIQAVHIGLGDSKKKVSGRGSSTHSPCRLNSLVHIDAEKLALSQTQCRTKGLRAREMLQQDMSG
ncbi:hypothetical protein JCM3770_002492 [Rhodotorula araucariae]